MKLVKEHVVEFPPPAPAPAPAPPPPTEASPPLLVPPPLVRPVVPEYEVTVDRSPRRETPRHGADFTPKLVILAKQNAKNGHFVHSFYFCHFRV